MLKHGSNRSISRRGFLGGALTMFGAPLVAAMPSGSPSWIDYGQRLSLRLDDAGGGLFDPGFAYDLLDETNRFRQRQRLDALEWDDGLAAAARAHAADMLARGYFEHQTPEGFRHVDRVALLNRDFCGQTAENLAWRFHQTERTYPSKIETMWEESPGHRENLLSPLFRRAGFGVVRSGGRIHVAAVYGDVAVRLGKALPFNLSIGAELEGAIATATPNIERLSLTVPGGHASWMMRPGQALRTLSPGVWQIRPLRKSAENRYQVLSGPLFHVA